MDSENTAETSVPERQEVHNYEFCWRVVDPEFAVVGKKRVSEIGVPVNLTMSNEPLNPVYLPKLMATLEGDQKVVKVAGELTMENPWGTMYGDDPRYPRYSKFTSGKEYWEQQNGDIALALTNRVSEVLYRMKLMAPGEDPAVAWAKANFDKLSEKWKDTLNIRTEGEDILLPHMPWDYINPEVVHANELEGLTKARLEIFAQKLGIEVDGGSYFGMINEMFSTLRHQIDQDMAKLTKSERKKVEKLMYEDKIPTDGNIIPWGVVATDTWEWSGFKDGKVKATLHVPTNSPGYSGEGGDSGVGGRGGGDFHVSAQTSMWRWIKDRMDYQYEKDEQDVPYPPNLSSGYRVIIPYEEEGEVKRLGVVCFNDISRINPEVLREAKKVFKWMGWAREVVFVAPDKKGKNQLWEPSFSDTTSADFKMAVKTTSEPTRTIKYGDIYAGFSG